ncbi:MAG TPA: aspartate--tRNA ligase, partial [Chthoniobacterales bacterium]|nr:aspartate--tRNA ligase [Chthoniobacterales bacterium]
MINPAYRTHHCNELRKGDIGVRATLAGWVHVRRDHGGVIFIDLRDREGLTQVVFRPEENAELANEAHHLRHEDVIQVEGTVSARVPGTENAKLATGDIELVPDKLQILNRSDVLPFPIDAETPNEDLRLSYRYVDLRRPRMTRNLRIRHRVTKATRDYLDEQGFLEIETPILSKSTPEGARDFLVPSRMLKGKFYALPQAPQQYKQLLMVGGLEKYFQIAKCFRDEDLRSDRQPEFTQIDIEASFVTPDEIFGLVEGLLAALFRAGRGVEITRPFPRMTYAQAMDQFGSDKPDRRFGMQLTDLADIFRQSSFKMFRGALDAGGAVKAINAKAFASLTIGQSDELTAMAKHYGAKGLAFIKVENGEWKSPIVKFFTEAEKEALRSKLVVEEGDLILFAADKWEVVCEVLGRIRSRVAEMQNLTATSEELDFLWVTDFPLLAFSAEDNKWNAVHHPFTRPKAEDVGKLEAGDFGEVRAEAYDVVLNGVELGGGSIRIHEPDLQAKLFAALGVSEEDQQTLFGHILRAFRLGTPPHGGIAFGLDRIVMLIAGEATIREVMAFP